MVIPRKPATVRSKKRCTVEYRLRYSQIFIDSTHDKQTKSRMTSQDVGITRPIHSFAFVVYIYGVRQSQAGGLLKPIV